MRGESSALVEELLGKSSSLERTPSFKLYLCALLDLLQCCPAPLQKKLRAVSTVVLPEILVSALPTLRELRAESVLDGGLSAPDVLDAFFAVSRDADKRQNWHGPKLLGTMRKAARLSPGAATISVKVSARLCSEKVRDSLEDLPRVGKAACSSSSASALNVELAKLGLGELAAPPLAPGRVIFGPEDLGKISGLHKQIAWVQTQIRAVQKK
eukprot:CAMPEP_0170618812 /NCGR_PEP_ID=MMETSP0224-20130122/27162_1 /TAXON_ID=285029 /ORGANISM="Togula jolla, Strain CCCM 725" /LENGTH=211 /DNA_ID=CAMNT_0010944819 /DNA_START=463 /DNA_END=1099 /DNA_ORIENTATION=+